MIDSNGVSVELGRALLRAGVDQERVTELLPVVRQLAALLLTRAQYEARYVIDLTSASRHGGGGRLPRCELAPANARSDVQAALLNTAGALTDAAAACYPLLVAALAADILQGEREAATTPGGTGASNE